MRYEDEVRSQSVGDSAKRAKYLADIDRFISEHEKLTLRRTRDASAIKSLEKDLKVAQLSNSKLIQEAKIQSEDNRKLRSTLAALRQSTRLRIGSAIVTPASAIAGLWPKPVKRTVQPQLARAADIPPVIFPAKSSNPSNRPTAGHSPGPLSLPAGPLDREEELRKRVLEQPSKANVYNLLSHQYFVLGRVAEPAKLIVAHSAVWTGLTAKERQLIDAVSGLDRLTRNPPDLPPSQSSPGYQVERGRILYCAHSVSPYNSNGYSTRTAGLVKGLAQAGANIVIAARPGYPWDIKTDIAPKSLSSYTEVINGIEHFFSHGPTWTQGPLDHFIQQAADSYVQIAIRNRVETIQAASNHVTALPALIAARRLGIPFVYEVRGLWEITESSTKAHWVQSDRFNFSKQMETLVAGNSDSVFAITPQVRDELVNRGVAPEKILILPNAVDTDEFSDMPQHLATRTKLGLDDGTPVIGYAGSLVEYEGLSTLLDAFKLLISKGIRVRMVVVGDGATLPKLKSQAEQLGIAEFISFTGRIPAEEIPAFISVFDIMPCPRMILPVTEMVSPIKPLEAMAAGKAVVLSDLAPLRELAGEDGERARLFPSGDPNGLADVLEDLLNDPAERQAMGRRARLWVVSERTWKRVGGIAWRSRGTTGAVSRSPRKLSELTLGIIADEFTRAGLQPDISLVEVHPDRWKAELESSSIDAMFVESAWDGNEGTWRGKVGHYDDESFADLLALLDHCREHSIPTIFWNKEDPVHFNRFKKTATHFDHVFTSDDESIPGYLQSGNPSVKSVASLPFYAQPRLHNPLPGAKAYSHTVSYAGSYYGDRYKKRSDQLHGLLAAALTPGLTIYDRQHLNPDSPYRFPPDLAPYVSGGLTYTEMLDAYKAHPVHVNVNSVEQSGTMFSRRVFEVAACGGAVISGPGRGIEHVFGSIIPIVQDQPGARDLITYWMENEHARNDDAWLAMRAVFRSHTAAHRLTYVLRTAGLQVAAPSLDKYALRVPEVTPEIIRVLKAQSVRPTLLLTDTKSGPPHPVDGIAIETMNPIDSRALLDAGITLIGDAPVAPIDRTFYEDLLTSRKYLAWESARIESGHTGERGQGLAHPISSEHFGTGDLSALASTGSGTSVVLRRRVPTQSPSVDPSVARTAKHILVAGHDLKFAGGLISDLEAAGHNVEIDQWQGHSQHDEESSRMKLAVADIIFCEWTLGNAVWFASNKRQDQTLVCRLHLQELTTPYLRQLNVDKVDRFIFVGQHIAKVAQRDFRIPASKSEVIPNYVDTQRLSQDKSPESNWNLGLVGIVPQRKRLDLALDVLHRLRRTDDRYHLFIKGKRPEDFPWMADRPDELKYYLQQYRRIEQDPLLSGAVTFDAQGDDMAEWYRKIGTVLSVSDFESFHLTLADGAASGALPTTLAWAGADQIYPPSWISPTVEALTDYVATMAGSEKARSEAVTAAKNFVDENFSHPVVLQTLKETILKE